MAWRIGEILIQKKWITWEQLQDALGEHQRTKDYTGAILVRKGYISNFLLYRALAEQFHMRFVDLERTRINPKAVERIPRSIAVKYTLMPIELHNNTLQMAITNPLSAWPETELKELAKVQEIRAVLCLPSHVEKAILEHYGPA